MKLAIVPLIGALFALLAVFGFNVSEDIQAAVIDNATFITNGVLGILTAYAMYRAKKKPAEPLPVGEAILVVEKEPGTVIPVVKAQLGTVTSDEHADVNNSQGGFMDKTLMLVVAMAAGIALLVGGCASFSGKSLDPDVRAAAVMRDARAVAETCIDLVKKDRLSQGDAQMCLYYVDQAVQLATAVHVAIVTARPGEDNAAAVDQALAKAESIIASILEVLVKLAEADKPISKQSLERSVQPLQSFDGRVEVLV